jgi:putative ABC transport system permease protein
VVAGIALSLVLVLSAGLLMRSFLALVGVDLGFDPRPILVRHVTFPPAAYTTAAERQGLYADALQRILAVPGVAAAAASSGVPPFGSGYTSPLDIAGRPPDPQRSALIQFCTDRYFQTVGLPFLRGGPFADGGPERHAVVSRSLAASYFGSDNPVGQHITIAVQPAGNVPAGRASFEIVGVVSDVRNRGPREPVAPHIYLPEPALLGNPAILIRTSLDPAAVAAPIRAAIRTTNRSAVVREPGTIEDMLGMALHAQPRFGLLVISLFAGAGTLLVGIGVFSVMAFTVSRQTREIALRMALGASRRHVMRRVLRSGGQLLSIGVAVGLAGSFLATRLLAGQLWGVSPYDPQTVAMAVALVTLVALLACYVPARRAIHVDPITALRLD